MQKEMMLSMTTGRFYSQSSRCMRKSVLLAAVCTLWLTFAGSAAADIVYPVDLPVGTGGLVTGTITTDGALGTLFNGDIVSWNLMLTDPMGTATMTPADSTVFISGGSLSATPTDLSFDFNRSGAFVNFNSTTSPGCPPQLVFRTDGGTSCNGTTGDAIGLSTVQPPFSAGGAPGAVMSESGPVSIAAIPEPATVALMVAGLVSLIGLRKRRVK